MDHLAGTARTENRDRSSGYVVCERGFPGSFSYDGAVRVQLLFDNGQEVALLGLEQSVGVHLLEASWEHVV